MSIERYTPKWYRNKKTINGKAGMPFISVLDRDTAPVGLMVLPLEIDLPISKEPVYDLESLFKPAIEMVLGAAKGREL